MPAAENQKALVSTRSDSGCRSEAEFRAEAILVTLFVNHELSTVRFDFDLENSRVIASYGFNSKSRKLLHHSLGIILVGYFGILPITATLSPIVTGGVPKRINRMPESGAVISARRLP